MTLIIYGSSGYIGSAVVRECVRTGVRWKPGDRRFIVEDINSLCEGWWVVNCAAAIPDGGVSLLNENKTVCLEGNAIFPSQLAMLCAVKNIPLVQCSTGCFYDESKEWEEHETPVRDWRDYCGAYLGSKWLAERAVAQWEKHYILRLRLPFDEYDHPRNYLSKLARFETVWDHTNSLTHRGDFAKTVLEFIEKRPAWGTYHVACLGQSYAKELAGWLVKKGVLEEHPVFTHEPGRFGCRLSVKKLIDAGIEVRHVTDALDEAIRLWTPRMKSKS